MPGLLIPIALLAALLSVPATAGDAFSTPPERPRIGLVLSGGVARGAAHAGVLRVLEELRVPVHCIAGTSMGAIVGGLYASGVSPDDIAAERSSTSRSASVHTGSRFPAA